MQTLINRGYKFKIVPTSEQKEFFLKSFGCTRKIYNHYVDSMFTQLEQSGYVNGKIEMKNIKLDTPREVKALYEYMKEVDSLSLCNAQIDFKSAIKKFNSEYDKKTYSKRSRKREKTLGIIPTFKDLKGMPTFKSIKKNDFSYKTNNQSRGDKWRDIVLENSMLSIPKIKHPIKVKQHRPLPNDCIIKNVTISMDYRGNFFASLCVEYYIDIEPKKSEKVLGLDYSQHDFYYSSENEKGNYPRYYRKTENKLKQEQRKLSRKVFGSSNWKKQKKIIQKLQSKIANQRLDWLHKESRKLANEFDAVCVEDINLRALGQCLNLAKNQQDNGFGMFRLFLKYKLEEQGKQFIKIDKWFPSSKLCSCCGTIKEKLELSDRVYKCDCGLVIDRDYNAALNIKEAGTALLAW